jgi:DNA helicase HerA-like ATPase
MKKFTVKPRTFLTHEVTIGLQDEKSYPERILIGRLAEAGGIVQVWLETTSEHVVAIFGKRGSGKSYTLGTIIEGFCTREKDSKISIISKKKAVLLFDTLGIYQWMDIPLKDSSSSRIIKSQISMQRKWNMESEPLDILLFEPKQARVTPSHKNRLEFTINTPDLSSSDWGYLLGLNIFTDRMGQLLNEVYVKVTQEGWSDGKRNFQALTNYFLDDMINCLKNDTELSKIYHFETRRALLQQLIAFSRNPLFQREGTKLKDLLKPGYLSILLMHKIPDDLRLIIVSSLIKKIIENRIETSEIEKHQLILPESKILENYSERDRFIPPCWIIIDEAQNILPSERKNPAAELLVKLVREGRNFGLSVMITTQQPSAIDQRILAQVDTMVVHRLTVQQDIEYVRKNIKSALPEAIRYAGRDLSYEECLRLLDVGQALVSDTELERAFLIDVRPRISVHGGF